MGKGLDRTKDGGGGFSAKTSERTKVAKGQGRKRYEKVSKKWAKDNFRDEIYGRVPAKAIQDMVINIPLYMYTFIYKYSVMQSEI